MNICEVKGLCKEYPSFRLDNVSFSLREGAITGFIGRNGAGKTTVIKSILGLTSVSSGEISYFGLPLYENETAIKQRIGYSCGAVNYYPKKKLSEILAVTSKFYSNWNEAACREYLELFKLDINKKPCELSEGMKVKFNLLLALSHKAELLILDEPTSGLDPFSRDELLDVFCELKSRGAAILFSTHITSDIEKCADDIMYIDNGLLRASSSLAGFKADFSKENETLEQTLLRLGKEAAK